MAVSSTPQKNGLWQIPDSMLADGQKNILNWVDPKDKSGEFKRQQSTFRDWISSEEGAEFPAEKDRYHLCERQHI
ncbi:S-glutathionyl-(chloro)hydroquinone reductase [Elasticomyces elasticus]|nr:S-glutathionyl-(chloro)hydroquinone reductase [Elasticomyces elasticus]